MYFHNLREYVQSILASSIAYFNCLFQMHLHRENFLFDFRFPITSLNVCVGNFWYTTIN